MANRLTIGLKDSGNDVKQVSFRGADNLDGTTLDARLLAGVTLRDAVLAVTLGNQTLFALTAFEDRNPNATPPADAASQTFIQWVVKYADTVTGAIETLRLPTAEITDNDLLLTRSDYADMTDPRWATFKGAFEAFHVSSEDNPVTILDITLYDPRKGLRRN